MRRALVVLLCTAALLSACGRDPLGARVSEVVGTTSFSPSDRVDLPPISGQTLQGGQLSVGDLRGKVVVLNSWASWCLPCNDEAAALAAAFRKFQGEGVEFVGLDVTDQDSSAHEYTSTYGIKYPSILDPKGTKLASIPSVPPGALPSTLIIDRQGRIAVRFIGAVKEPAFSEQVKAVLAEE